MNEKKKTNIIVLTDFSEYGMSACRHAASLASFFQSSLTIVYHFSFQRKTPAPVPTDAFRQWVAETSHHLEVNVMDYFYHPHHLHHFADRKNTIMYVIAVGRRGGDTFFTPRRAMRFIQPSRLPVLTVGKEPPRDERWQNVLLAVDPDRQAKEKALWAGYFSRFGGATVRILHSSYREQLLADKLEDGLEFIDKLYKNLEINCVKCEVPPRTDDLEAYAIAHAPEYQASLLVAMTTQYRTWVDVLFGPREQQWISNREQLPVLCINERDDLYVLCT